MKLGLSGGLTKATIGSPLTPLSLVASLVMGLIAVVVIPREEEPQISVPMVDIRVNADGLRGPDAVELVTKPLEAIVKGIDGVEHVYSQTEDDRVMVTARFLVGTKSEDAILRIHEKIRANIDRIPVGISEPLFVGRGINDVLRLRCALADPRWRYQVPSCERRSSTLGGLLASSWRSSRYTGTVAGRLHGQNMVPNARPHKGYMQHGCDM